MSKACKDDYIIALHNPNCVYSDLTCLMSGAKYDEDITTEEYKEIRNEFDKVTRARHSAAYTIAQFAE